MRIVYIDIDTLRLDHLGCYGHSRPTSPNIDALAAAGARFEQVYASDSPCLPSRAALMTGTFGFRNGVVNHGGERADPHPEGPSRGRQSHIARRSLPALLGRTGHWCSTISTFGERHSAFQWYAGFNEVLNLGTDGMETADQVGREAIDWLIRRGHLDDWFLHVHFWDPHTPYRTPAEYPSPWPAGPTETWIGAEELSAHWQLPGPHSAQDVLGFGTEPDSAFPRQPSRIRTGDDVQAMLDGYDLGVSFADHHVGRILEHLDRLGLLDDTAVVVSSDHGENLGELGIYGDHQTADAMTHRIPLIVKWPGAPAGVVDRRLRYHLDLAATLVDLTGTPVPDEWDGTSFADVVTGGEDPGRDHLVLSCAAWSTQRAVRFDRWLYIRTFHDGFHGFPEHMLFDLENDPYERHDLAGRRPAEVAQASGLLEQWTAQMLARTPGSTDPLQTVLGEGGGYYVRHRLADYLDRLRATGRADWADRLAAGRHPDPD